MVRWTDRINRQPLPYSKRHNKFLLPVPAKAIYGNFCRIENEIFNVVNYKTIDKQDRAPVSLSMNTPGKKRGSYRVR